MTAQPKRREQVAETTSGLRLKPESCNEKHLLCRVIALCMSESHKSKIDSREPTNFVYSLLFSGYLKYKWSLGPKEKKQPKIFLWTTFLFHKKLTTKDDLCRVTFFPSSAAAASCHRSPHALLACIASAF
jgi:hypothetical protein